MSRFRFFYPVMTAVAFIAKADAVRPAFTDVALRKEAVAESPAVPEKASEQGAAKKANPNALKQTGTGRARYTRLALRSAHVDAAYRALCAFLGEKMVAAYGIDRVYGVLDASISRDDYGDYQIVEQKQEDRWYVTTITRTVTPEWLLTKLDGLPELRRKLEKKAGCTR